MIKAMCNPEICPDAHFNGEDFVCLVHGNVELSGKDFQKGEEVRKGSAVWYVKRVVGNMVACVPNLSPRYVNAVRVFYAYELTKII